MGKKISPSKATKLCDNFDEKYLTLNTFIRKEDNRSVLFSIEELKDYFSYLEESGENVNGIRVYLGSNTETNLNTVFFAPTLDGKDNTTLDAYNYGGDGIPPSKKYGK